MTITQDNKYNPYKEDMIEINIKKLSDNAVVPFYASEGDAGMDLVATSINVVDDKDYGYIEYGTDLAFEIPKGYVGLLYPRSSISKSGLILANSVGVVDSGYRGEVKLRFKAIPNTTIYNVGDKVGQIMVMPYPIVKFNEVEVLNSSDRGEGGFGSTGV
jgi:dUTP pyrophosphatase